MPPFIRTNLCPEVTSLSERSRLGWWTEYGVQSAIHAPVRISTFSLPRHDQAHAAIQKKSPCRTRHCAVKCHHQTPVILFSFSALSGNEMLAASSCARNRSSQGRDTLEGCPPAPGQTLVESQPSAPTELTAYSAVGVGVHQWL